MFWASDEIDEATQQAVIDCLKANNPSYKGHWDEFFFGQGDFTWEFKKNKSVTYSFTGKVVVNNDEESVEAPTVDEPVVEEPKVEEPTVEETKKNNSNNGNKNKDKNNNKNKNK